MIIFLILFSLGQVDSVKKHISYLIKIDLAERDDIYRLDHFGIPMVEDRDTYVLADVTPNFIALLKRRKFKFQVLDENPKHKDYYLVFLVAEKNSDLLKPFGKILLSDTNVVLLRAFKNKEGLFMGRWELKKLRNRPIRIRYPRKSSCQKKNDTPK